MPPAVDDVAFTILGRPFRGHGIPEALRAWLIEQWRRPEHDAPAQEFSIGLEWLAPGRVPAVLEGEAVRAMVPGSVMTWIGRGPTWEWRSGDAEGVRLTLDAERARIDVWGGFAPGAEPFTALYVAICEALRASGLLPLHAAVAAPPAQPRRARDPDVPDAIALLGRRGTGKSTTLLRLARSRWTPIAEDLCWVDPESLTLYGWDRGVRLWPETLETFFPDLAGAAWVSGPDGKLLLDYDDLARSAGGSHGLATAAGRRGTLAGIALLHRTTAGGTGWEPLPARDAVRALWEAVGVPLGPAPRQAAAAWIGAVAARLPLHRLRLGTATPGPPPAR